MPFQNRSTSHLAHQASKALSRRRKDTLRRQNIDRGEFEVDYDNAPTLLYKLIERKDWDGAVRRTKSDPDEARTWVYRRSGNDVTKIRWRILPIHSAVIFRSSVKLIDALVEAYPDGPKMTDDQRMLPIHLASRIVASKPVIISLLNAYPDCIKAKDRKGRTPLRLAEDGMKGDTDKKKRNEREEMMILMRGVATRAKSASPTLRKGDAQPFDSETRDPPETVTPRGLRRTQSDLAETPKTSMQSGMHQMYDTESEGGCGSSSRSASTPTDAPSFDGLPSASSVTPKAGNTMKSGVEKAVTRELDILFPLNTEDEVEERESNTFLDIRGEQPEQPLLEEEPQSDEALTPSMQPFGGNNGKDNFMLLVDPQTMPPPDPLQDIPQLTEPPETLKKLLDVISGPTPCIIDALGSSSNIDLDMSPNHTRRVNACGAMKALTMKVKNRVRLCRVDGVVSSLCSVLTDSHSIFEERHRSIRALINLSVPRENYKILLELDGSPFALTTALNDPYPKIRHGAAKIISTAAKYEGNRKKIMDDRDMISALVGVINRARAIPHTDENLRHDSPMSTIDETSENDEDTHACETGEQVDAKAGESEKGISNGDGYGGEMGDNGMSSVTMDMQDKESWLGARRSAMTAILHLSKIAEITHNIARSGELMTCLMKNAGEMEGDVNLMCVAILTNLTRLPSNALHLVYHVSTFVPTLVKIVNLPDSESRKCAICALQNLSCSKPCRQQLANTPGLLAAVAKTGFSTGKPDAQISALHTFRNLSDEPANIVTVTDTPGCMATLVALANDPRNEMLQYLACDALATLSLWLRESAERGGMKAKERYGHNTISVGPTLDVSTWEEWQ